MTKSKKVLLVIDSLGSGGAQRQMINLASGLVEQGSEVQLLSLHKLNAYTDTLGALNLQVTKIHSDSKLVKIYRLMRLLRAVKPSHVIVFLYNPSLYVLIAALFNPKIKIIVSERTFEECVPKLHKNITRRLYFRASAITANSWRQTDILRRLGHHQASFIPNGVHKRMMLRRKSFDNSRIIISIGRVSKLKNPQLLFKALEIVNSTLSTPYQVLWLGDYTEHSDFFEECERLWKQSEARNFWTWVGRTEEVNSFLDKAYFLYHGSFGEGSPNAVFEALARGLPVLASDVFDHNRLIVDTENGYLFDPQSVDELVSKILTMDRMTSKEYEKMSGNAFHTIADNFSNDRLVESYSKLLREI
jgi:glycosyltransferase involved in cell wall biosynthesis